jgi:phage shock protein E
MRPSIRLALISLLLAVALPSFSLAAGSGAATLSSVAPGVVDGATARRLVAAGARLVDVRTPEEFAAGHLPGAILIPHDQVAARARELGPSTTPIVLYCRSGRRTGIAAGALASLGYARVWDLRGMGNW